MRRTRSPKRMILIKQDLMQWQPYWMAWSGDRSPWKLLPGYTPCGVGHVTFRKPRVSCLFRVETENKHMKKAAK